MNRLCVVLCSAVLVLLGSNFLFAQQRAAESACPMPSFSNVVHDPNMFSEEQEEWLGDIMAQQLQKEFSVVEDPEGGYLQSLGERILAQLPPTKIHYRFFLIDQPINNSFGLAGGRIYVSRKLVAFTHDEDELAGLLGHEIGHIITHQVAIDITRAFREVLHVIQVGDRQDIFDKWNRLMDNAARGKDHSEKREQQEQLIADRIALYAMARAGYQTSKFPAFFDRLAQTKGNTGNVWTDLFGATSADSKRLRELLKNTAALPANCVSAPAADARARFPKWQKEVIELRSAAGKEDLPGLIRKTELKPALRSDLLFIHFSPDGKLLLAQDPGSIFVLSRDPLANLFRIDAPDAYDAQFSPDSRFVIFYDRGLRVEKWDIAAQKRAFAQELVTSGGCNETSLSPDGDVLACMNGDFELQLIDVSSGKPFFTKKNFYEPTYSDLFSILIATLLREEGAHLFTMGFSPDNHYFLIGRNGTAMGYDLKNRSEIKLSGKIKEFAASAFAFTGPDRMAGVNPGKTTKSALVHFPSGETIEELSLGMQALSSSADGKYLLLRPVQNAAVGAIDLAANKAVIGFKKPAFDVYGGTYVGEQADGELVISTVSPNQAVARIALPQSPLAGLRASGFSSDGNWLALSGRTRGAVFSLKDGGRKMHIRGFEGSYFDHDSVVVKVSKFGETDPQMAKLEPLTNAASAMYPVKDEHVSQLGDLLITLKPSGKSQNILEHSTMEVHDVQANKLLWTRGFGKQVPSFRRASGGSVLTLLFTDYDSIKAEAKNNDDLSRQLSSVDSKKDAYLVEILEAQTGKNLGGIVIDTNKLSFTVRTALAAGDTIVVSDSKNRTLLYSLKSGQQIGKVFGHVRALSKTGDKLLVENEAGQSDLYDSSLKPLAHYAFPTRISLAEFAPTGDTVSVLTSDQVVYSLKSAAPQQSAAVQ
jgi:Peptidase family M48